MEQQNKSLFKIRIRHISGKETCKTIYYVTTDDQFSSLQAVVREVEDYHSKKHYNATAWADSACKVCHQVHNMANGPKALTEVLGTPLAGVHSDSVGPTPTVDIKCPKLGGIPPEGKPENWVKWGNTRGKYTEDDYDK